MTKSWPGGYDSSGYSPPDPGPFIPLNLCFVQYSFKIEGYSRDIMKKAFILLLLCAICLITVRDVKAQNTDALRVLDSGLRALGGEAKIKGSEVDLVLGPGDRERHVRRPALLPGEGSPDRAQGKACGL